MNFRAHIAVLIGLALAAPAFAQKPAGEQLTQQAGTPAHSDSLSEGEVRKVDKDAKKITIKHGQLNNLDMPPMTMVFQVKDPALLGRVKVGDKVKFQAEKLRGAYTVTRIEPGK